MTTAHSPASAPSERPVLPIGWGRVVALAVVYVAIVLAQALSMRVVDYEAFEADGPSMMPTLLHGDRFVIDKGAYGLTLPGMAEQIAHWADPEPGDVVVLRSPADEVDIVKRIIGVAGDRIRIEAGAVYRNGEPIAVGEPTRCESDDPQFTDSDSVCVEERIGDRHWRTTFSLAGMPESLPEILVPEGTVFVMGDHRDHSNDSRNPRLGNVPVERVQGRALGIYWSDHVERAGTWIE